MNPLVWFTWKQVRLSSERATDDAVLATGCDAKPYAALLLAFVKERLAGSRGAIATTAPMAQRSTVGVRVERILDQSQRRGAPRLQLVGSLLALVLTMAALIGGLQNAPAQQKAPAAAKPVKEETKKVTDAREYIQEKLQSIIIPEIKFSEATIEEAVDALRRAALENDHATKDPKQKGVNIIIRKLEKEELPKGWVPAKINLHLTEVPLSDALNFTSQLGGYKYRIDPLAVVLVPPTNPKLLFTQTFRTDPDCVRAAIRMTGKDPSNLGSWKPTGENILKEVGIPFPEGASATLIRATSELVVHNNGDNMELVQLFIDECSRRAGGNQGIRLSLEIYRLPTAKALELVERYGGKKDTTSAVAELRRVKGNLVASPSVLGESGQRSRVGSGEEYPYISGYKEEGGKDIPIKSSDFFGTLFEIDPVMTQSGEISFHVAVTKTFGKPVIEKLKVKGPASGEYLDAERVRVEKGVIRTQGEMASGETRLLGTISPPDGGDSKQTLLVFLHGQLESGKK